MPGGVPLISQYVCATVITPTLQIRKLRHQKDVGGHTASKWWSLGIWPQSLHWEVDPERGAELPTPESWSKFGTLTAVWDQNGAARGRPHTRQHLSGRF